MKLPAAIAALAMGFGVSAYLWRASRLQPDDSYQVDRSRTSWGQVWFPRSHLKHPLLILSPAMGGRTANYNFLAFALARQGFVVAGVEPPPPSKLDIEHRRRSQADIDAWIEGIQSARSAMRTDSKISTVVDWDHTGIFGHSFGGATAVHLLKRDPTIRRAANLDGASWGDPVGPVNRPVLFLMGAPLPPSQARLNEEMMEEFRSFCRGDTAECRIMEWPGALHMNFSDTGLWVPPLPVVRSRMQVGTIDGRQFLRELATLLGDFFRPI